MIKENSLFSHQFEYVQFVIGVFAANLLVERALVVGGKAPIVRFDFIQFQFIGTTLFPRLRTSHLQLLFAVVDVFQCVESIEFDLRTIRMRQSENVFVENHFR